MNYQKNHLILFQQVSLARHTHLSPMNIVRLSAERNYTFLYKEDGGKILFTMTLKRMEEILKFSGLFIRVNRKDSINVNFILQYNPDGSFLLKNGVIVVPSRRRVNTLKKILLN